jgi:hypothetical protein
MSDIEQEIKNVLETLAEKNFSVGFDFPASQALEVAIEKRYPGADGRTVRTLAAIHAHYDGINLHERSNSRAVYALQGTPPDLPKERRLQPRRGGSAMNKG